MDASRPWKSTRMPNAVSRRGCGTAPLCRRLDLWTLTPYGSPPAARSAQAGHHRPLGWPCGGPGALQGVPPGEPDPDTPRDVPVDSTTAPSSCLEAAAILSVPSAPVLSPSHSRRPRPTAEVTAESLYEAAVRGAAPPRQGIPTGRPAPAPRQRLARMMEDSGVNGGALVHPSRGLSRANR